MCSNCFNCFKFINFIPLISLPQTITIKFYVYTYNTSLERNRLTDDETHPLGNILRKVQYLRISTAKKVIPNLFAHYDTSWHSIHGKIST